MKFYIISTDSVYEDASAIGIRCKQLNDIIDGSELLVPDLNYQGKYVPYDFEKKEFPISKKEKVIMPLNAFPFEGCFNNIIVDGISPILVEENYLDISNKEKEERHSKIINMFLKAKAILYATEKQKYYYSGILSSLGIDKPLIYIPFYLPLKERRLKWVANKVIIVYGGIYPWVDIKRILDVFQKFPKTYSLLFKGVKHPRYKRDKGLTILLDALKDFQDKKRVFIDTFWGNESIEVEGSIFFSKGIEQELACRTRILDLISQGIPVITDEKEESFNLGKQFGLIKENSSPKNMIKFFRSKKDEKGLNSKFSKENVKKLWRQNFLDLE